MTAPTLSLLSPAKLNLFLHIPGAGTTATTSCRPCSSCWTGGPADVHPNAQRRDHPCSPGPGHPAGGQPSTVPPDCCSGTTRGPSLLDKQIPAAAAWAAAAPTPPPPCWRSTTCGGGWGRRSCSAWATLGADVPVFVGGHRLGRGYWRDTGARWSCPRWYVIITPPATSPQVKFFPLAIDTQHLSHQNGGLFLRALPERLPGSGQAPYPDVDSGPGLARRIHGEARLTGTGSSVFASFDTEGGGR